MRAMFYTFCYGLPFFAVTIKSGLLQDTSLVEIL